MALTVLLLAAPAWAQPGRFYDLKNVVTLQGQVEKVETLTRKGRRGGGRAEEGKPGGQTQIMHLKTDQGVFLVHLGPTAFLANVVAQSHTPPDKWSVVSGQWSVENRIEYVTIPMLLLP